MLDLILKRERLVGDGKAKSSSGCSKHDTDKFGILRVGIRAKGKLTALDFGPFMERDA